MLLRATTLLLVLLLTEPVHGFTLCGLDEAQYCEYDVPDLDDTGDNFYGGFICDDELSDWYWDLFNFDREDWDSGFGWNNYCDVTMALGRTYNAIMLLNRDTNWFRYIVDLIGEESELDAKCYGNNRSAAANTCNGADVDDRVELYMVFFYTYNVAERAAALVHEARHIEDEDLSHVDNCSGPPESCACTRGPDACDPTYGNGAYSYEAWVLWDYSEAGPQAPRALREKARQSAQAILDGAFVKPSGVFLDALPPDACAPGEITDVINTGCVPCPPNTVADTLNSACISCGLEQQANYNQTRCIPRCDSPLATLNVCADGYIANIDATNAN